MEIENPFFIYQQFENGDYYEVKVSYFNDEILLQVFDYQNNKEWFYQETVSQICSQFPYFKNKNQNEIYQILKTYKNKMKLRKYFDQFQIFYFIENDIQNSFRFSLKSRDINQQKMIFELNQKVPLIQQQSSQFQNTFDEIDKLYNDLDTLKKENNLQTEKKQYQLEYLRWDYLKQFSIFNFDSKIIKNQDFVLLNEWINDGKSKLTIFILLYRGSRDGFESKEFFSRVNEIENILIAIEDDKMCRFGGYSAVKFNSTKYGYSPMDGQNSNQNFLYSLDLKKKFKFCGDKKEALYNHPNRGPQLGTYQCHLKLDTDFRSNKNSSRLCGKSFQKNSYSQQEFLSYNQNFSVNEIEVYAVFKEKQFKEILEGFLEFKNRVAETLSEFFDQVLNYIEEMYGLKKEDNNQEEQ